MDYMELILLIIWEEIKSVRICKRSSRQHYSVCEWTNLQVPYTLENVWHLQVTEWSASESKYRKGFCQHESATGCVKHFTS
jgi:hypothetical protein